MKINKIGIIGGGNMGEALIKGLYKSGSIFISEANPKRVEYLKKKYNKLNITDIPNVIAQAQVVILAVKPQDMHAALSYVRSNYTEESKLFISIAAGLTTKFFEDNLKNTLNLKPRIVRAMPNMPGLISEGMTGICKGRYVQSTDLKLAQSILDAIGETVIIKEDMMDAVTAVSGSGPAYVFLFVEQWINAAVKLGFDQQEARQLVYKTLIGSVHLLDKSYFEASELRLKVTSKGGTTQAAMDVFSKGKFDQLIYKALLAAKNRSKELAK